MEFSLNIKGQRAGDEYEISVMAESKDEITQAVESALGVLNGQPTEQSSSEKQTGSTSGNKTNSTQKKRGPGRPRKNPPAEDTKSEAKQDEKPADSEEKPAPDPMAFEATRALLQRYINTHGKAAAKKILTDQFNVERVRELTEDQIPELHKVLKAGLEDEETESADDEI